jgi:hypothetical protein
MHMFLGRVRRREEITGVTVSLDLLRMEDAVELVEGDEFVTVQLQVDPFEAP